MPDVSNTSDETTRSRYKWWFGWAALGALGLVTQFFAALLMFGFVFTGLVKEGEDNIPFPLFGIDLAIMMFGVLATMSAIAGAIVHGVLRLVWHIAERRHGMDDRVDASQAMPSSGANPFQAPLPFRRDKAARQPNSHAKVPLLQRFVGAIFLAFGLVSTLVAFAAPFVPDKHGPATDPANIIFFAVFAVVAFAIAYRLQR
jgi:hypothetical protein